MLCKSNQIGIRKMQDEEEEYTLLLTWLTDEEILRDYQGRDNPSTMDSILKKYRPRIQGLDRVTPCFILYDDCPIGYIQFYRLDKEELAEYGYEKERFIYGIDLLIGEINYQNKGIGQLVIPLLLDYIKKTYQPEKITIDPRVTNERAIRCYEKCGFIKQKILPKHELHEGVYHDNLLMEI